jgi:hypothetical protein
MFFDRCDFGIGTAARYAAVMSAQYQTTALNSVDKRAHAVPVQSNWHRIPAHAAAVTWRGRGVRPRRRRVLVAGPRAMPDSTQSSGRLRRRIAKLIAMIEMPATRPAKRVMRRSFAAYASAELMKVLPEQVASIGARTISRSICSSATRVSRARWSSSTRGVFLLHKSPPSVVAPRFNTPELSPG